MKAKEIQELIDFISNSGLAEVKIETDEFKLSVKKSLGDSGKQAASTLVHNTGSEAALTSPTVSESVGNPPEGQDDASNPNYLEVKSPMIGTFYRTPNPDSDPFVNLGDTIKAGQTVCIIEAMKLFNEIESEVSGKIVKVLVENATPVEFDQPLFLVDPAG